MKLGKILTFKDIIEDDSLPPEAIIENGVLLDQSLLIIIAPAKSKKTFLCMNFAKAIASGNGFAGFDVNEKNRVLYLCAEGGYYPNRDRIKVMSKDMKDDDLKTILFPKYINMVIDNNDDFEDLKKIIDEHKPKVVIMDPFIRFHNVDENSSTCMSGIFKRLRELIEIHNISIILVHHSGKDPTKGGRGSSVITGEYDSAIIMKNKANSTKISFDMRHVDTPDPRFINLNQDTLTFECSEDNSNVVVEYLDEHGEMSKADLVKVLVQSGACSQSHSYRLIDQAISSKILIESDDGYLKISQYEKS